MKSYQTIAPSVEEFRRRTRAKTGRKRTTQVTLSTVHALLKTNKFDAMFADEAAERKDLAGARVKLSRVSLALQSDPQGIRTGEYAERPRYGVGEVTAERMQKIQKAAGWVGLEQEKTAKGADTGLQRRRIKSVIEVWFERGAISRASWLAAQALQRDHDLSISCTSSMIAKYQPTVGVAYRELMGQEAAVEFQRAKEAAIRAVKSRYHIALAWIMACSNADVPAEEPAKRYYPGYSDREAVTRFKGVFEMACAALAEHYQHKERHQWEPRVERTARAIAELVPA